MTTTETKWAGRIQEWQASGKRAEEFVADRPFKASTLRWWATELRRRSGEGVRPRKRRATSEIRMARVVRRGGAAASQASGVVVEVSGARIAVGRGFDAELLSEVVRVLGGAR